MWMVGGLPYARLEEAPLATLEMGLRMGGSFYRE